LKDGHAYGTNVPFESKAIWYSPDMQLGPQPAEVIDADTRRIKVPWGSLYLHRRNDNWVVTTQPSDEPTPGGKEKRTGFDKIR
jgi:hypothetical protein